MKTETLCRITPVCVQYYPRKFQSRKNAVGVILDQLPRGAYVVEWPWGIAINHPYEVEILSSARA
jgi:hypothetical protein